MLPGSRSLSTVGLLRSLLVFCLHSSPSGGSGHSPEPAQTEIQSLAVDQGQQERAALVAGLADGGDVDGGVVLDGTLVLADTAADALDRVDERAFELESCTPAVGDLDVAGEDGLGADRADLLADDATCVHRPGQAASLVVKGRTRLDRPLALERADPQLLGDR